MELEIQKSYKKQLPKAYIQFLTTNPEGTQVQFNEYYDTDPDLEGRDWRIFSENELLEVMTMKNVGTALYYECLKLYVGLYREIAFSDETPSNVGEISLKRVEEGFVFGEENGDYLYLDAEDSYSVWIYYHDGGDVKRIADSFKDFIHMGKQLLV